MEAEQNMTGQESLAIISQMIKEARKNFSDTAIFFLIWGAILATAGIAEYLLMQGQFARPYLVWPIAGVVGGVISGVIGARLGKRKGASTLFDRLTFALWTSFFITLVIFIFCCVLSSINPGAFIMVLTGLPTITTGLVLKFKPLIFGGIVFWVSGIVGFFIPDAYLPLLFSLSIILGYIIPGLLLRKAEGDARL